MAHTARDGIQSGLEQMLALAAYDSPKHGYALVQTLVGNVNGCFRAYPDDPALAACHLMDTMPAIIGLAEKALAWAQAVNQCDPSDIPDVSARLGA